MSPYALVPVFFSLPELWYTCAMRFPERFRKMLDSTTKTGNTQHFLVWTLILGALALRVARLTFQPLWWDEGWSLYFAGTDVRAMLELTAVDIHPPLYYTLLHWWIGLFGSSVFSVRLMSVLIGTATVPLLYTVGRQLFGRRLGLLAAFLLAVSPFHIYYSQEVRMYGLVTLLGLIACCLALREGWAPPAGRWKLWLGYVLAATAALYTQYYAAFLVLALNLVVLLRWLRKRRPIRDLVPWLGSQVAVALLFLPWLVYAGEKLFNYVRFKVGVEGYPSQGFFAYLGRHLAAFTWGHAEGLLADWWWLGLVPLAFLALALLLSLRSRVAGQDLRRQVEGTGSQLLVILAVLLLCGFVLNLVSPFNPPRSERSLLLALPNYLLLAAGAWLTLWRRRRPLAVAAGILLLAAVVVSLALFYTVPRYPDDDYRPVAGRIHALGLPGDAVVCIHPWQVGYFEAYIPEAADRPALVLTPREVLPRERQLWADDPALMAADLDALLSEHGRLWLPDHRSMGRVLESRVEAYLVEYAYPVLGEWYGQNTVLSFFVAGETVTQPVTARFADWLTLERAAPSPGPLEAAWGVVAVDLAWQLSQSPSDSYQLGLRLVDDTGHVWAQRDAAPLGGLEPFSDWPLGQTRLDRHGLLVPAGTPPGDYRLTLRVYRSQDQFVLPVAFEGGSGGEVVLGTVRVVRPETPPPVAALGYERPLQVDFGDRLRLLGANVPDDAAFMPGWAVQVELFWQALADLGEDFYPRLQLLDAEGVILAELVEKPVAGTYPTAWWRSGELVRDPHALPIPATVQPGRYRLALSLIRAADGAPVGIERGETLVDLAEIEVQGREHLYEPPAAEHLQGAPFGQSVELIGYDLREAVRAPGSPLAVALYWHALQTPDRNYHTFVHLLDAGGNIVAQHDGPPGEGELPTLGWLPGEYLTDPHLLNIPFDLPDGQYRLRVGLYDPVTGLLPGDPVLLETQVPISTGEGCLCP